MKLLESKFKLLSSLEKVFFDFPEELPTLKDASLLKNEIYSFQLATYFKAETDWDVKGNIVIDSELKDYITIYKIDYVPGKMVVMPNEFGDDDFITKNPSYFPDLMHKLDGNNFVVPSERVTTFWFALEPRGEVIGRHNITIKFYDEDDNFISEVEHNVNIINAELPKQKLICTGWFHGDCIAALHNVEIGSDEYYEIVGKFIDVYHKFGHNMILTPLFTPPLDTDVGAERPTNQLVKVTQSNGEYTFDFNDLDRWIDICLERGIEYFEMSHLFTQWGAEFTPKVMATVDGEYKRIFGWDVKALSEEYTGFLATFMPALIKYLKEKNVYDRCFFHVSDEPSEQHTEQYTRVSEIIREYVGKERMMDAISDYVFFEKGLINRPVPSNDHIDPFLDNNVENLWTYYCCCQGNKVANRFMAMPSYRNRILGYQLYKYNIEGFLQWGFNFWFGVRSRCVIDPHFVADANNGFPAGDAFVVYPLDETGEPETSLRLYVFNEGLQDMRALELLESLAGRETAESLLTDINRFADYPRSAEYILNLRDTINKKIEELI